MIASVPIPVRERVVRLFRYWTGDAAPERQALLRRAAIVIIAYTIGVCVIFLCF